MKKILALFSILLASIGFNISQNEVKVNAAKDIDIYLIAGQSNAVGQTVADVEQLSMMDSRFEDGFENVLYYGYTDLLVGSNLPSDLKIQNAKLGLGFRSQNICMGPEAGMAYYLSNTRINNNFGIIKYASGASSIYDDVQSKNNKAKGNWYSPSVAEALEEPAADVAISGNCYRVFLETVNRGLQAYKAAGYNPIIKGLAWMQGEAECNQEKYSRNYALMLNALIKDFRENLTTISGQDLSEMDVVVAKIPTDYLADKYTSVVREQQQMVADSDVNVKTIDNDGFSYFDGTHYVWQDMLKLGMNFSKAFLEDGRSTTNTAKFVISDGGTSKLVSQTADAGTIIENALIPNTGFELLKENIQFLDIVGKPIEVKYALQGNFLTFIMPECDVIIDVKFKFIPQFVIDTDCENGEIYRTNPSRNPYRDEKVTLTFVPDDGYEFSSLKINGVLIDSSNIDTTKTYPCYSIIMSGDIEVEVEFKEKDKVDNSQVDNKNDELKLTFKNPTLMILGIIGGGVIIISGGLFALLMLLKKKRQ